MQSATTNIQTQHSLWSFYSFRLLIALLLFSASSCKVIMTVVTNVTVLCISDNATGDVADNFWKRPWSMSEQATILSTYFLGAVAGNFAIALYLHRLSPKILVCASFGTHIFGSFLFPIATVLMPHSAVFVSIIRLFMGFGGGLLAAAAFATISKWFKTTEHSTAIALFTNGNQIGTISTLGVSAIFCKMSFMGGWPLAFLSYASLASIFFCLWIIFGSSSPQESKFISEEEKQYITDTETNAKLPEKPSKNVHTPWKNILTSPCITSICLNAFVQAFIINSLAIFLQRFNIEIHGIDLTQSGVLAAAPFLIQLLSKISLGMLADHLKKRGMSKSTVAKLFNNFATFGSGIVLILVPFVAQIQPLLSTVAVCFAMIFFGCFVGGYNTAIITVAPDFVATITAWQNLWAQVGGAASPYIIGYIVKNKTLFAWKMAFSFLGIVLIIAGAAFQIFGHGKAERWNGTTKAETKQENDTLL